MPGKKEESHGIGLWPEEERPRERLLRIGEHELTNAELIAILLRIGVSGKSAVELGREILMRFGTVAAMARADVTEWREIKGLGDAKICQLKAALELGRRSTLSEVAEGQRIHGSKDAVKYFIARLQQLPVEHFRAMFLNRQHRILDDYLADEGTVHGTRPRIREMMSAALRVGASSMIVAHNHPSGSSEPSPQDEELTRELLLAARSLEIRVLDHLIVGREEVFSFADSGLLDKLEAETGLTYAGL